MGDRALVRQGSLVSCALLGLTLAALGADPPAKGAERESLERRPYTIRAWVAVDPLSRLDARGRELMLAAWRGLARRFVGPAWEVDLPAGNGPLGIAALEELQSKQVRPLAAGVDKAWMIEIAPSAEGGLVLSGREFDATTGRLGLLFQRNAPCAFDAARELFQLTLDMFAPFAEIGESAGGGVTIAVQGGSLPPGNPVGRVVAPGMVFQPLRVFQRPNGAIIRIDPIRFSYLRVDSVEGPLARCGIVSGLRDPLSKRVVGKYRLIALGLKPSATPTRLRFQTPPPDVRPAAGYTLTVRRVPDGQPRDVGTTDRAGRIVLPPHFADGLVVYRLLAGNIEPLVEFPGMPGETPEERVVRVRTMAQTVTLESRLNALKDEIVDLVATRSRLEARLKRLEVRLNQDQKVEEVWAEIKAQVDEFKKLKPRDTLVEHFNKLKTTASKEQEQSKLPVLTRTAMAQLTDTEALMSRYLDDDVFKAYEEAYLKSRKEGEIAQKKAAAKAKAKTGSATAPAAARRAAPPVAKAAPPATPKPAAPQQKKAAGVVPF
jgi:hypothetical protein